uniref:condensation domain-containing protein n=1 Tax=Aquimarina longa TaxID=1080221 RepID=UPI000AFD9FD3
DSIITIQVISRLKKSGYQAKPRDIFENQTVHELSKIVQVGEGYITGEQGILDGACKLLPIQEWYFNEAHATTSQYNQSILLSIPKSLSESDLDQGLTTLVTHHDALRFKYEQKEGEWKQEYCNVNNVFEIVDITNISNDLSGSITEICNLYQQNLSIRIGKVFQGVLIKTPNTDSYNRLFIVAHHLVIDGVSWRILINDIEQIIEHIQKEEKVNLGAKGCSYRQWFNELEKYAHTNTVLSQQSYWSAIAKDYQSLPVDKITDGNHLYKDITNYTITLDEESTSLLTGDIHHSYTTEIDDILLASLALTIQQWSGNSKVIIGQEGHGREDIFDTVDIGNTIGWFTNLYPVLLPVEQPDSPRELIKTIKEQLRSIPDKGIGYGALRYLNSLEEVRQSLAEVQWDVVFNYLGQLDNAVNTSSIFKGAKESSGVEIGDNIRFDCKIEINCSISMGQLRLNWSYLSTQYYADTVEKLANEYITNLKMLIIHCRDKKKKEYTPSDYGLENEIAYDELDAITKNLTEEAYEGEDILEF